MTDKIWGKEDLLLLRSAMDRIGDRFTNVGSGVKETKKPRRSLSRAFSLSLLQVPLKSFLASAERILHTIRLDTAAGNGGRIRYGYGRFQSSQTGRLCRLLPDQTTDSSCTSLLP